jgi:tRNA(Ile)-lysidine synthase
MMNKMEKYIKKYNLIKSGDKIVVAFSGGPDSVYLLLELLRLKEKMQLSLAAVHVNHGLMEEAKKHEEFVRTFCEEHGVPLFLYQENIGEYAKKEKLSIEEAGRKFRYQKFYEVKEQLNYDRIAVAHHLNDRAETVLYRMARGTGWKGLAGIRPMQNDIIRPMLELSKQEILDYLKKCEQPYNVDPSNQDTVYARNQIRHRVLPELEKVNHEAVRHIAQMAEQMAEAGEYLNEQIGQAYQQCVTQENGQWQISILQLEKLPAFLQKEVLKRALVQASGQEKDLSRNHIQRLMELKEMQTGRQMDLPYGICATRQYHHVILYKKQKDICEEIRIHGSGTYEISFANGFLTVNISQKNREISQKMYTKTFDYDKIKEYLNVRTGRDGDYFVINRQGQHKKLNRYFIDQKIPGSRRKQIPVVADGHHIVWVIGGRVSEAYRVTEATKNVLWLEWRQMEDNDGT